MDAILARSSGAGKASSIHGPHHWASVAAAGLCLLDTAPGADAEVVLLFAMLHDSMRWGDGRDPEHGARAAALAGELREAGAFDLDDARMGTLAYALERHDKGEVSADPTIGACWDADRLNLWRVGRKPKPALMSTTAGRRAAELGFGGWPSFVAVAALDWRPVFLGYESRAGGGVYLRFGGLPEGGRSRIVGFAGFREAGVSVYPGHVRDDGTHVLDFRGLLFGLDTRYLSSLLQTGRPLYVVEGPQVGFGNMGEPVLSDARIAGEVQPGGADVLPDRPRFRALLAAWRAKRRGKDPGPFAFFRGGPDPEERPLFPPFAPTPSLGDQVRGHLKRWGALEEWDRMRMAARVKGAQRRRERRAREELERQADPFGWRGDPWT